MAQTKTELENFEIIKLYSEMKIIFESFLFEKYNPIVTSQKMFYNKSLEPNFEYEREINFDSAWSEDIYTTKNNETSYLRQFAKLNNITEGSNVFVREKYINRDKELSRHSALEKDLITIEMFIPPEKNNYEFIVEESDEILEFIRKAISELSKNNPSIKFTNFENLSKPQTITSKELIESSPTLSSSERIREYSSLKGVFFIDNHLLPVKEFRQRWRPFYEANWELSRQLILPWVNSDDGLDVFQMYARPSNDVIKSQATQEINDDLEFTNRLLYGELPSSMLIRLNLEKIFLSILDINHIARISNKAWDRKSTGEKIGSVKSKK